MKKKIRSCQATGSARSSLGNPAQGILNIFQKHERIVVTGVGSNPQDDLPLIYAYLVEPAFACGCTLVLEADCSREELLLLAAKPEPEWRFPWSRERLLHLLEQGCERQEVPWPEPVSWWRQAWSRVFGWVDRKPPKPGLDPQQMAAVEAGDGVVQIIAPAGSGKTTVLIQRVKELQQRGTPPDRILCMSFNRDAKVEIGERLAKAGLAGVVVRSFHGMGLAILKEEGKLRQEVGSLDGGCLKGLVDRARVEQGNDENGGQPSITEIQNAISEFKLASMITPEEAVGQAEEKLMARVYQLYEEELARRGMLDFDDLVARSVGLLQKDQEARQRWQNRFDRVLVDEYQDIEPSQALLVGILAAPQDSLFCVGDEDQCIYAWRRATVQRIIELDQMYPGLERHALIHNYRCGRRITAASRKLIQHNQVRFRKPLVAGAATEGKIVAVSCGSRGAGARLVAYLISDAQAGETMVLARTSRLLDEVKQAGGEGVCPEEMLTTMHGSKGREWDRVILYGVDEGQAPHSSALAEGELEAERRLFYVALTRAKERLEIVCTKGQESRFLKEAGIRVHPWATEEASCWGQEE